MQRIELKNGHSVKVYQSALELPAIRYNYFNCYRLQATDIGNDLEAIDGHFSRAASFMAQERTPEAADELALLHFAYLFALQKFNPSQLAFGCLVAAVDDAPTDDLSEEGLTALIEQLSSYGLTQGQVEFFSDSLKKK